jgi:hypothetical protein
MPRVPQPRNGDILVVKDRPLEFSFWPVERTTRRYGLGTRIFATDPWTVIRRSTEETCTGPVRDAALAMLEQAHDFYRAAESGVQAAKPLLLYYCFMNLAKAFILQKAVLPNVNSAQHGLSEQLQQVANPRELIDAYLDAYRSPNQRGQIQNFDVFLQAISGSALANASQRLDLTALMPQIVPGHRLWVRGGTQGTRERFISVERVEFRHDATNCHLWLRLYVIADDLSRVNMTHQRFLLETRIANDFGEVTCDERVNNRTLLCFEQIAPVTYAGRPSDNIPRVVSSVRQVLWATVRITDPYRKYYLYAAPVAEHVQVLPQVLSIYAITYYLGSIVRYRPHHFDRILEGRFGPFIEAFLNDQPNQFVYLMASEFAEKEVTKAAIV